MENITVNTMVSIMENTMENIMVTMAAMVLMEMSS